MAHGSRKRWLGALAVGAGVAVFTAVGGCHNTDKAKDTKATTPTTGLPGTPTLPPSGTGAMGTTKGAQTAAPYAGSNLVQQPGGTAFGPAGSGTAGQSVTSNPLPPNLRSGQNALTSPPQQAPAYQAGGIGSAIAAPTQPGIQPAGGSVPSSTPTGALSGGSVPPAPSVDMPLPPPPPGSSTSGANFSAVAPMVPTPPPALGSGFNAK